MELEFGPLRMKVETLTQAQTLIEHFSAHLSYRQAANFLGISERTLRRWRSSGRLPALRERPITRLALLHEAQGRTGFCFGAQSPHHSGGSPPSGSLFRR